MFSYFLRNKWFDYFGCYYFYDLGKIMCNLQGIILQKQQAFYLKGTQPGKV